MLRSRSLPLSKRGVITYVSIGTVVALVVGLLVVYVASPRWRSVVTFDSRSQLTPLNLSAWEGWTTPGFHIGGQSLRLTWNASAERTCVIYSAPNPCPTFFTIGVQVQGQPPLGPSGQGTDSDYVVRVSQHDFNEFSGDIVVPMSGNFYLVVAESGGLVAFRSVTISEWR